MSPAAPPPPPPPILHLRIERRGGLAGLPAHFEADYAALSAAQQKALGQVLQAGPARGGAPEADRFSYRLVLTHAGQAPTTLVLSEDDCPGALARLARPALP